MSKTVNVEVIKTPIIDEVSKEESVINKIYNVTVDNLRIRTSPDLDAEKLKIFRYTLKLSF